MPLVYTGPPDIVAKYVDIYRNAVPGDVASQNRNLDEARTFAEMVALGEGTGYGWSRDAHISTSHSFWLDQHALDRDLSRQGGEVDDVLRARLKTGPAALLRDVILDVANEALAAAGISGSAALLRLPADAAFVGNYVAMTGTGGVFAQSGTSSSFSPMAGWQVPPVPDPRMQTVGSWQLAIAGAANAGNNGTRTVTGIGGADGNGAIVTNGSGVPGADPTVTWTARRLDQLGNVTDGFARAFASRGYRATSTRPFTIVVILPFGTDAGTAAAVADACRVKKAAGFGVIVERRLNP